MGSRYASFRRVSRHSRANLSLSLSLIHAAARAVVSRIYIRREREILCCRVIQHPRNGRLEEDREREREKKIGKHIDMYANGRDKQREEDYNEIGH